jgi:hypothetical protein
MRAQLRYCLAAMTAASCLLLAPAVAAQTPALASSECNGRATAELTELKRASGVLTAKVRWRATGPKAEVEMSTEKFYVLDPAGGKKYEVLKDSGGQPLVSETYRQSIEAVGDTYRAWFKFPAPPADVKRVSLTMPDCEPLEDVPITDAS